MSYITDTCLMTLFYERINLEHASHGRSVKLETDMSCFCALVLVQDEGLRSRFCCAGRAGSHR